MENPAIEVPVVLYREDTLAGIERLIDCVEQIWKKHLTRKSSTHTIPKTLAKSA